jgi:putative two-component system response regulator
LSAAAILCVDDDEQVRRYISRILVASGHDCVSVGSTEEARGILDERAFAVVLCDIGLPGSSGLDLVAELGRTHPEVATVVVTGQNDPDVAETALQLGAYGYLTKPFEANQLLIDVTNALRRRKHESDQRIYESQLEATVEARTAQLEVVVSRLEASERELRRAYGETVARLSRAIESLDGETGAHVDRVGSYVQQIALALDLGPARAELLRLVSPLHDIGKIAVPDAVLLKEGELDPHESRVMRKHPIVGDSLCSGLRSLNKVRPIVRHHHERLDGTGYPDGLRNGEVPLLAQIVGVVDVFDALTTERPYRGARPAEEAFQLLADESSKGWRDRALVDTFANLITATPA